MGGILKYETLGNIKNGKEGNNMKFIKLKARNGLWWNFEKYFKNNNQFEIAWDWNNFGLGFNVFLGNARLYIQIHLLWIYLFIGICSIGKDNSNEG